MRDWPDWLSPEYRAVHQILENVQEMALEHCEASADAAGMNWTQGGLRSVRASQTMTTLQRLGFGWPDVVVERPEPYVYDWSYSQRDEPGPTLLIEVGLDWGTPEMLRELRDHIMEYITERGADVISDDEVHLMFSVSTELLGCDGDD